VTGRTIRSRLACVALFASAMGILEAICVVYLRHDLSAPGTDTLAIVERLGRFGIEHIREVCTLVMLATVAWLAGFNARTRIAAFFVMFGIWDITYYIGLRLSIAWPDSLLTWDCLFLLPVPWYGPVLAPVLISVYFVTGGVLLIVREVHGPSMRLTWPVLLLQAMGLGFWYWSFVKEHDAIMAGGYQCVRYSWLLFLVGALCAVPGLWLAARRSRAVAR
jgi:hypothetical protein